MGTNFDYEFEGKTYRMSYKIENGMLIVTSVYGSKPASIRRLLPQGLETILAGEILADAKRNRLLD